MPSTEVILNVYDLIEHNDWTYWCGVGVFHSGVEVFGVEYAYGGHEYDAPGAEIWVGMEGHGTHNLVGVWQNDVGAEELAGIAAGGGCAWGLHGVSSSMARCRAPDPGCASCERLSQSQA